MPWEPPLTHFPFNILPVNPQEPNIPRSATIHVHCYPASTSFARGLQQRKCDFTWNGWNSLSISIMYLWKTGTRYSSVNMIVIILLAAQTVSFSHQSNRSTCNRPQLWWEQALECRLKDTTCCTSDPISENQEDFPLGAGYPRGLHPWLSTLNGCCLPLQSK